MKTIWSLFRSEQAPIDGPCLARFDRTVLCIALLDFLPSFVRAKPAEDAKAAKHENDGVDQQTPYQHLKRPLQRRATALSTTATTARFERARAS